MENYLTVSALTKYIKAKLEGDKHLVSILIKGEVSNFKHHSRGHLYFTLKDEYAQISCIMFSRYVPQLTFEPKDGDHVLIGGRMSVYEAGGTYSIQVTEMKLDGIGELYLKYEALKKELELKGYFDSSHKKAIPKFPKRIGVVTSSTGAVIEDIKNTVSRRYLLAEIILYPALVQGPESSESIRNQILLANKENQVDVLIVGRGGGSIEDLWGFNELPAIMAIYESKIPVITAIGHETDFTLCDFVSDLRAPTPTAAAELATPNKNDLLDMIKASKEQIQKLYQRYLNDLDMKLAHLDQRLENVAPLYKMQQEKQKLAQFDTLLQRNFILQITDLKQKTKNLEQRLKSPIDYIRLQNQKIDNLKYLIKQNMYIVYNDKTSKFNMFKTQIETLNPLKMMDKGFAYIEKDQHVITSIEEIQLKDEITISLRDGKIAAQVTKKEKN